MRRCDGPQCPVFSARRLGFGAISGPELVPHVEAPLPSSAEERRMSESPGERRRPAEDPTGVHTGPPAARPGQASWACGRTRLGPTGNGASAPLSGRFS